MSQDAMMVFGYARVSTENQLENYSIDEQTARLKAYCAAKGWTLLNIYVDGGYSGGNTNRPALQEMLSALEHTSVDAVVVYKLDRLSRSQKDTLTLIEDSLLARGVDFVSINENFDTSTPFGRAMIGILSVFAQLEKDQITERFTMGRIGRGKAGYYHGGSTPPTGYDYVNGELIINEYEAVQVREIFSRFLSGQSINAIYRDLDARFTTKWSAAKVRNVLKNPVYIGKVRFAGQSYQGHHQSLIEPTAFEAANHLLSSSSREAGKNSAQKNPFRAGYLLSGLLYCDRCGARYSANHGYYKCYSRAKSSPKFVIDPNCNNDNWEIPVLDALICDQVEQVISSPAKLKQLIHRCETSRPPQADKTAIQKRLQEIGVQIQKLIGLYQIGSIPMEEISSRVDLLSAEKQTLTAQLSVTDTPPSADRFLDAVSSYKSGFHSADLAGRRLILSSLLSRITINGQAISLTWRF